MTDRVRSLEGFYVDEACQCAHAYWLHHTPTPFVRPFVHTCTRDACKMQSLDFTVYELDSRLRDHELPEGAGALCLRSLTPRGLLNVSADEQAAMRELVERVQTKRGAATCTPEETLAMETHAMKLYAAPPLFHVCVRGACPGPDYWPSLHHESAKCWSENKLSVCTQTGIAHRCSNECMIENSNTDTLMLVCMLTGIEGDPMLRNDFWRPGHAEWDGKSAAYDVARSVDTAAHNSTSVATRVESSLQIIFAATDPATIMELLTSAKRSSRNAKSMREDYYIMAVARVAILLMPQRTKGIIQESTRVQYNTMKLVKYYVEQSQPNRLPITEIIQFYASVCQNANTQVVRVLPEAERREVILDWARRCVIFWYIIRTYTQLGSKTPLSIPFYDFIDAALHIFADGIIIPASNVTSLTAHADETAVNYVDDRVVLMHTDALVHSYINYGATVNSNGQGDTLTRLKTDILNALVQAVREDRVPPVRLRIDNLSLEKCDQARFVSLARPKGTATRGASAPAKRARSTAPKPNPKPRPKK